MISDRRTSKTSNLISINRQIYDKINSKNKLNFISNKKNPELNSIHVTPSKLSKYSTLYSKYKSYSKASTKLKTINKSKISNNTSMKSNELSHNFSLCQLVKMNIANKCSTGISDFNNTNLVYPKTQNKKSRNIFHKFQKNSTIDKRISLDKLYPKTPTINSTLMHNTMKTMNSSYKKFFLKKKKIKIGSLKTKRIKTANKGKNTTSKKKLCVKKYKIAINDEDFVNNNIYAKNKVNNKMIKSILNLKYIQNKIKSDFEKKNGQIKKQENYLEHHNEFSFNKEYIIENLSDDYYIYNDNNDKKMQKNNNEDILELVGKKVNVNNLIQSNIITGFSEFDKNNGIYEENYECETPQFTTLDAQKNN